MALERQLAILSQDVRYSARGFLRNPAFTVAAVFALALGIGAGAAVFSVVDRILFHSLPYRDAGRLVSVGMVAPIVPQEFLLGYDYLDWRAAQTPFESMGSWGAGLGRCDLNDTAPLRLECARIDSTLLPTLGTALVAGRNFSTREERPDAPRTALISHALWQSRFAGDPAAIGRPIRLDGQSVTIAGVLPPEFELPDLGHPDVLLPYVLDEPEQRSRRLAVVLFCVARLKPGITPAEAAAALQPLFRQSLEGVPGSFRKDVQLRVRGLRDRQIQDSRLASWVLLASVLAVLLIACANVANLLLARAAGREHELAIRAALGAGRGRLIRQALTESLLLALIGGGAGCALAFGLLRFFIAIAPVGIPRLQQATIDPRVLLFALFLSLVSGILFGLAPAFATPATESLGARSTASRRHLFRQSLVAAQIAVSLVLMAGAGLLLRSLWNLENQPLGIRPQGVLSAAVTLGRAAYPAPAQRLAFFEEMEQRLRRIPGVTDVALADSLPPSGNPTGGMLYAAIDVQGRPPYANGTGGMVAFRWVTPRYFSILGIPILQGRAFEEPDRDPSRHVVIISDVLARRMFPGESPVGRQIRPGRRGDWLTIVGVSANVKNTGLAEKPDPEYYIPRKHAPENVGAGAIAILRTAFRPDAVAASVRAEIAALDRTLPVTLETVEQSVTRLAARPRFNALLLGIFAAVGLLLAAIGLYGVVSFMVAQRAPEIGVRMALGATPRGIARLVLGQVALWIAVGTLLGTLASIFTVRLLRHMLFEISANDPSTFAAAVAILAGVALAAAWIPSRRAAHLDPLRILRQE